MPQVSLLSKIQGCLCGVAIGDALGMPWEMMTPGEIFYATNGQGVHGFSDNIQRKITGTAKLKAGDTTDDWQLTRAIARSIIKSGGIDHVSIAREHVTEFHNSTLGWGRSTKQAISAMAEYFHTCALNDDKLPDIVELQKEIEAKIINTPGTGNGVAMKIAPIAIYNTNSEDNKLLTDVINIGQMTHRDPRATYAACAIALIIKYLMESSEIIFENNLSLSNSKVINTLTRLEILRAKQRPYENFGGDSFTSRLINLLTTNILDCPLNNNGIPSALIKQIGTGCFALESIPFSVAVFLRHTIDFKAGVLEAVNAGGDTDSNASMVGAMIGANIGLDRIPNDWIQSVPACQEALDLADKLYSLR